MIKYLITDKKGLYKANLHSHSTVSDGLYTPEELKKLYQEHGYSIIAFSDHSVVIPHKELNDESFLSLTSCELDVSDPINKYGFDPTCHFNIISSTEDVEFQPLWQREREKEYLRRKWEGKVKYDESEPPYIRSYTPECISYMMNWARERGYFVIYDHPVWSCEGADKYMNYHGMHAFEIMNYSDIAGGWNEHNDVIYDEMLRAGKRIFAVAGDDNHLLYDYREHGRLGDCCGAYTVINAEKLEYKSVIDALFRGDFYSSEGPSIYEIRVEDGKVYVRTSECENIVYSTAGRRRAMSFIQKDGKPVTEGVFEIRDIDCYFRITVTDKYGKKAYSNAYFLDELFLDK